MAKLKGPLFSLAAAGSIAKTLVYARWKGVQWVRVHVIPANPDTQLQKDQRGYLRTLVGAVHDAMAHLTHPLDAKDQVAYSALASTLGRVMTWFNMACKLGMDALRLKDGYTIYSDGTIVGSDKDDFRPTLWITDDGVLQVANGKFYLGTTKSNLSLSEDATVNPGINLELGVGAGFSGLTAGTKYFWQFRPAANDPCEGSVSGIYYGYTD